MATLANPLVDALYRINSKAEIIEGKIVHQMATGRKPAYAVGEVFFHLRVHIRGNSLNAIAVPDNAGFLVNLPNRSSFSPDAAYYVGPNSGMRFFEGSPVFAVEVRSENDYGVTAEAEMAAKRRDYFAAGSLVVWDVDLLSETMIVRKYTAEVGTDRPAATFHRDETADAEPAVPGWTMPVNDLFED
jgi:Uma2 family endonuclease